MDIVAYIIVGLLVAFLVAILLAGLLVIIVGLMAVGTVILEVLSRNKS